MIKIIWEPSIFYRFHGIAKGCVKTLKTVSHRSSTIAAISTPPAPAGLGVIRLSGDDVFDVAQHIFRPVNPHKNLASQPGYTALYGHVFDEDGDIDECVALVFRAPHSYTGENVVELSCHGGLYLLQRVLRAALKAGAAAAGKGEFTRRAFLNGKLDLTRAEAVMNLIGAEGKLAAKTALAAREGAVYKQMEAVKNTLLAVSAQFSAFIDYPDDDIPALEPVFLSETLEKAQAAISHLLETFDAGRVLREGIDTVIAGSPNVGKSTLMNLLSGCERSIVTPIAGTTRDVVEETVRLGDVLLRLADTAGIRETGDVVENVGVERARSRIASAALVLAVFDGSRPLSQADKELAEQVSLQPSIAIVNKADQPLQADLSLIQHYFSHMVVISAEKGEGIGDLEQAVAEITGLEGLSGEEPILATERQRDCAARSLECINEALCALTAGMTLDAVSVSVEGAISAILELTGERATEAVVEEVFSRFCVGK